MLFNGKKLLTASAIALILSGCAAQSDEQETVESREYPEGTFCYKGGKSNNYSCYAVSASNAIPMHTRAVDEEWMYLKLEEIRAWLKDQKAAVNADKNSPQSETKPSAK